MVSADEPQVKCIVRDFSGVTKYEASLPESTTVNELFTRVAESLNCNPLSFTLALSLDDPHEAMTFTQAYQASLKVAGFNTNVGNQNLLLLNGDGDGPLVWSLPPTIGGGLSGGKKKSYRNNGKKSGARECRPRKKEDEEEETCYGGGDMLCLPFEDEEQKTWLPSSCLAQTPSSTMTNTTANTIPISEFYSSTAYSNLRHPLSPPIPSLLPPPSNSPTGDYAPSPISRHDIGYVGLVNQAMTCYLNSLLQALYMTPEFRNALYKWKFDSGHNTNASKCIPFQLQKLFLNLQTSNRTAVETTELTKSFGWDSGEVWQQHDIQELCRVMFDALEHEFKETEQADLINQLYQGKMIDYVKCLECDREKSREDSFLDIPLPVRPFGVPTAYKSIHEALKAFVQPETLDGSNQYFCESCNKKCDAHKGLKFLKFPYLLTLHLKRFDFDYTTMHRIKLNDSVSFPEELDLNSFVQWTRKKEEKDKMDEEGKGEQKCDESLAPQPEDEEEEDRGVGGEEVEEGDEQPILETQEHANNEQTMDQDQDVDEGIYLSSNNIHVSVNETKACSKKQQKEKGPFIYQLYSIMIHSGSASGGHYYAYIKDFAKDEWFCFNDQSVTRITHNDIEKTYGGGPSRGYYSGAYSSSTNAYMLMYRQIDKLRNASAISEQEFPPHIKKLLADIRLNEENERAMRDREKEMVKMKVYTSPNVSKFSQDKIYCLHDTPFYEVLCMAHQGLQMEKAYPLEQCRLVSYIHSQNEMELSFEGRDKDLISDIVSNLQKPYEFFLETREKHQVFTPYSEGDISITVYRVNLEDEEVMSVHSLKTTPQQNLLELKKFMANQLLLPSWEVHMVLVKPPNIAYVSEERSLLYKLGFYSTNKLYICSKDSEPLVTSTNFPLSKLYRFIEKVQNIIILHVILPDISTETLEKLMIPSLNEGKFNGNNNRQSDLTPTGDGEMILPVGIPNGGIEDEGGICSGAGGTSAGGGTSDQSASEDSSLTDSERTIIGDVPNEGQLSSTSDSEQQLSPPDGNNPPKISDLNKDESENWDDVYRNELLYFKAIPYQVETTRLLRVVVARTMSVGTFKMKLEPYLNVSAKYIKLYRGTDVERGADQVNFFTIYKDEEKFSVKLHRSLDEGELRIKLQLLSTDSNSTIEFCDWIVSWEGTIGSTKRSILRELERKLKIRIPFERCRLWKKNLKNHNHGQVLANSQKWEDEICGVSVTDVFIQESSGVVFDGDLEGNGKGGGGMIVLCKRWRPSTLTIEPFKEIIFKGNTKEELKEALSNLSEIPCEFLKISKGTSSFPCDISVLSIHNGLDWSEEFIGNLRLGFCEDGIVIYYKDSREELKVLSKEEEQELSNKESARLNGSSGGSFSFLSPRKEKALKIYLNAPPPRQTRPPPPSVDID